MPDIDNALWLCARDARRGMRKLAADYQRQDAAIEDLRVSVGYAQAADERLTREIAELTQRIAKLENQRSMMDTTVSEYLDRHGIAVTPEQATRLQEIADGYYESGMRGDFWSLLITLARPAGGSMSAIGQASRAIDLPVRVPVVGTVDSATGAITWTDAPPAAYTILEPVRDDALDDDAPRTATPNQTYSWLPGDAWDQYCADAEGEETP